MGRLVYEKHMEWQPTQRRPASIEQKATVSAILDHRGIMHRMQTELRWTSNMSKQPLGGGAYDQDMVVSYRGGQTLAFPHSSARLSSRLKDHCVDPWEALLFCSLLWSPLKPVLEFRMYEETSRA